VLAASIIALMMEAASTFAVLVNFYHTTWCNNPEDSHLQVIQIFSAGMSSVINLLSQQLICMCNQ
jgi:hypothetical protein